MSGGARRRVVLIAGLVAGVLLASGPVLAEPGRADPSLQADAAARPSPVIDGSSVAPLVSTGAAEPARAEVVPGAAFASAAEPGPPGFVKGQSRFVPGASSTGLEVWANPDGSTTVNLGVSGAAPPLDVSKGSPGTGVEIPLAGDVLVWRHPDALVASATTSSSDAARFDGALPGGRDVLWVGAGGGFEESVVVPSVAGGASYRVEMVLPNGVSARDGAGGVELVSAAGDLVGGVSGGVASDAAVPPAQSPVSVALAGKATSGTVELTVSVDGKWLADPSRVFPVTIDPSCCSPASTATWVQPGLGAQVVPPAMWTSTVKVRGGSSPQRALLALPLTFTDGLGKPVLASSVSVRQASLVLPVYSPSCPAGTIEVYGVSGGLDPPSFQSTAWTSQPATDGYGLAGLYTFSGVGCPSTAGVDVTALVRRWARGVEPNVGFEVRAANESVTSGPWEFCIVSVPCLAPYLSVTLDGVSITPLGGPDYPDDNAVLPTPTPSLRVIRQFSTGMDEAWFTVSTGPVDAQSGSVVAESGWVAFPASPPNATVSWTVPPGVLRDGQTYRWTAKVRPTGSPSSSPLGWSRSFRVDLGVGAGPRPVDSVGPVSVNMATNNVTTGWSSPSFAAVAGPVGVSLVYNSNAATTAGLTGTYFDDADGVINAGDQPELVRRDSAVNFDWSNAGPYPAAIGPDHGFARWTGTVTPPVSGSYQFGAASSMFTRVWVNGTLVLDRWFAQTYGAPVYGTAVSLTGGVPVSIKVDTWDSSGLAAVALWVKGAVTESLVPGVWFSTGDSLGLPPGWTLATGLGVSRIEPGDGQMVVVDSSGKRWPFLITGSGFTPPPGTDWILGYDQSGQLSLFDGTTIYAFDTSGQIVAAQTAADDRHPAAITYAWSGSPARLRTMTDPVSGRQVVLSYGGDAACPTSPPSGLAVAPTSILCKIDYWDATSSVFWYTTGGQLSRVVDPGGITTDWAWSSGRLASARTPLAADAIAAGVRVDDATARYEIAYDGTGKPTGVTLPAATAGGTRYTHSYSTDHHTMKVTWPANPTGIVARSWTWDTRGRVTSFIDHADPMSSKQGYTYDDADHVTAVTSASGIRFEAWTFDTAGVLQSHSPPYTAGHASQTENTTYDQSLSGLAATYWANTTMTGAPYAHDTTLGANWGSGVPVSGLTPGSWSARFTGIVTYTGGSLSIDFSGYLRAYVNDRLVMDWWSDNSAGVRTVQMSTGGRVRIDYKPGTAGARMIVATATPRYNLPTLFMDSNLMRTATTYAIPSNGLPTQVTVDSTGLALTTTTSYETAPTGWLRPLTTTLPAGNTWTTAYWGDSQLFTNPCPGGVAANQAGLAHTRTGPDPDAGGPATSRVEESVYDAAGRVVASRLNSDAWTCAAYDSRGRPSTRTTPAFGGSSARTTTWNWAVGANPLVTSIADPAGTITTTSDLLGRVTSYTDVWGQTTATTYDDLGRLLSTSGPAGAIGLGYTTGQTVNGMVATVSVDGTTMATASYANSVELSTVAYGNGTSLTVTPDVYGGLPADLQFKLAGGASLMRSQATRVSSGRITDSKIDGAASTFTYDTAGRLTAATIPGHTLSYTYPAAGGCGLLATAGKNTDRATMVDNGVTSTYCYDNADRLTFATGLSPIVYDTHGNTTTLGASTLAWDNDNRNAAITTGAGTATYARDATGRIVARTDSTGTTRYVYADGSDSPAATADGSGVIGERFIALPGGVTVTRRTTSQVWSYPNIHGDVAAVADASGSKVGTTINYDPYGQPLTTPPDNVSGAADWGWLGQHQKFVESSGTIQMGARPYLPALGRFLSTDPIVGGSCSDFDYTCGDPIQRNDLDGKALCTLYVPDPDFDPIAMTVIGSADQICGGADLVAQSIDVRVRKETKHGFVVHWHGWKTVSDKPGIPTGRIFTRVETEEGGSCWATYLTEARGTYTDARGEHSTPWVRSENSRVFPC